MHTNRRPRRRRRKQVTCLCERYPFPHRLGGGRCHGRSWAEAYFEDEHRECRDCNCHTNNACEVALGQESITYCQGAKDHLYNQWPHRHPKPFDYFNHEEDRELQECPF